MAVYGSLLLINKMPGDLGIVGINFRVRFFNLLFVFLYRRVFVRVNESGFKKEIPQCIKIYIIADIRIFIFGLVQHGDKLEVVVNIHVEQCQAAFNPLVPIGVDRFLAKNYLGAAFNFVAVCKTQIEFMQNHSRQQRRVALVFFY